jgi:hypothetical protein
MIHSHLQKCAPTEKYHPFRPESTLCFSAAPSTQLIICPNPRKCTKRPTFCFVLSTRLNLMGETISRKALGAVDSMLAKASRKTKLLGLIERGQDQVSRSRISPSSCRQRVERFLARRSMKLRFHFLLGEGGDKTANVRIVKGCRVYIVYNSQSSQKSRFLSPSDSDITKYS